MFRKPTRYVFLIFLISVTLGFGAWFAAPKIYQQCCSTVREIFVSPDRRFSIVVYKLRVPELLSMMPGQSSDAPGYLRLVNHDGTVLQEADVEMVSLVEDVEWEAHRVRIKLIADWELPLP